MKNEIKTTYSIALFGCRCIFNTHQRLEEFIILLSIYFFDKHDRA